MSMLYVALGDSLTHGHSPDTQASPFPLLLKQSLSLYEQTHLVIHARPGWTSTQLLRSLPSVHAHTWDQASLVTLVTGGNDILFALPSILTDRTTRRVAERLGGRLARIIRLVRRDHTTLVVGTLYNPFPYSAISSRCVQAVNRIIEDVGRSEGALVVPLHEHFSGNEPRWVDGYKSGKLVDVRVIDNPIHPNRVGHRAMADAFLTVTQSHGRRTLAEARP